jgi:hypothetical protein
VVCDEATAISELAANPTAVNRHCVRWNPQQHPIGADFGGQFMSELLIAAATMKNLRVRPVPINAAPFDLGQLAQISLPSALSQKRGEHEGWIG